MGNLWEALGFIRWPISFAVLMIVALSLYSTVQVYKPCSGEDSRWSQDCWVR